MHRISNVGVAKQQSAIFRHRHRSAMFFLANRNQACCFGEHNEVFGLIYNIIIQNLTSIMHLQYFFITLNKIYRVCLEGISKYLMPPYGKHVLLI